MSNLSIVIINKDQEVAIPLMVEALKKQLPNTERCFVLDRCVDKSKQILIDLGEKFVENHEGVGFCAATARNLGLNNVNINNDVLFLDGDRIPYNLSIDLIQQALDTFDLTLIKCEIDKARPWFTDSFRSNPHYHTFNNCVWSCGFSIRRSAIENIKTINNGRLFNELFNGRWGYEDLNLGDMALVLNLTCGAFPDFTYLDGELYIPEILRTVERTQQHNIRKLLRMALFIKFNKVIDN